MAITRERLMELVHYDPATGIFTNKVKRGGLAVGQIVGSLTNDGYFEMTIDKKRYKAHRLAWLYTYGCFPHRIDHINRIRTDNRLANLRECNSSENSLNTGMLRNNTSGFKGVTFHTKRNSWLSRLAYTIDGVKTVRSKWCKTFEEACEARLLFERELNSPFLQSTCLVI